MLGYLVWPSIARQALEVLHCTKIGTHSVLEANHSVFCEGAEYSLWRGFAVMILCTLVPGFPAIVFTLLYRNQKKIAQGKHADDPAFRDKYLFFFGKPMLCRLLVTLRGLASPDLFLPDVLTFFQAASNRATGSGKSAL